jgi:addiction module RelE/StbE family toxin
MSKNLKRIDYSRKFDKQLKKAPLEIKLAFRKKLEVFINNQFHLLLNNHALSGNYKGYRSINITGNWRAIYIEDNNAVIFVALGTHNQLYK